MAVTTELVCAIAIVSLVVARGMWPLAACLAIRQLGTSANTAARATLMGRLVPPEDRIRLRAYQRSVTNIGFSVGALLAAVAMAEDTAAALYALLGLDAATFCFGAVATSRLPEVGFGLRRVGIAKGAARDTGYLAVSTLNAVHTLNRSVVSLGIPLWIVYASRLPRWTVAAAMILNTGMVIWLQIPLSPHAEGTIACRRSLLAAGLLTAAGCAALAIASAHRDDVLLAWVVLAAACLALSLGEILGAAAGWTLSYDLADHRLLGQYQALWQFLADVSSKAAGPAVIGWGMACGQLGWAALATGFTAAGAASPPLVSWAVRRRRDSRLRPGPAAAQVPGGGDDHPVRLDASDLTHEASAPKATPGRGPGP